MLLRFAALLLPLRALRVTESVALPASSDTAYAVAPKRTFDLTLAAFALAAGTRSVSAAVMTARCLFMSPLRLEGWSCWGHVGPF
jgi:hypothetical protein